MATLLYVVLITLMYVLFAPLLIALAAGTFLFVWAHHKNSTFGKFMGAIITLASLLLIALQTWNISHTHKEQEVIKTDLKKMMKQIPDRSGNNQDTSY